MAILRFCNIFFDNAIGSSSLTIILFNVRFGFFVLNFIHLFKDNFNTNKQNSRVKFKICHDSTIAILVFNYNIFVLKKLVIKIILQMIFLEIYSIGTIIYQIDLEVILFTDLVYEVKAGR